jgi:hypothetical protein
MSQQEGDNYSPIFETCTMIFVGKIEILGGGNTLLKKNRQAVHNKGGGGFGFLFFFLVFANQYQL